MRYAERGCYLTDGLEERQRQSQSSTRVVERAAPPAWGRPKTEEVIALAVLKGSINRAGYAYTGKWLGAKEEIRNKGGSLSNRLRGVLQA